MEAVAFDPAQLSEAADPYAELAALRAVAPVAAVDHSFVAVTGYAAASDTLRHPGCRSSPIGALYLASLPDGAARNELGHRINFLDPPDHPRVRRIVNTAFTPRRVAALRPWMEHTTDQLLDRLDGLERFDILREVAHQLPSLVISELLGVPPEDRELLTSFSDDVAPLLAVAVSPRDREGAIDAAERFHAYLVELLDDRARQPRDDLLSALLAAEDQGDRLSRVELLSLAATLYSAGHRTTRDLFTNGLSVLLGEPDRYDAVASGRWQVPDVVEEMLRYETPTLYVARVTAVELELDGVMVPAGAAVLVFLSAANRDPAVYDDPDSFRPGRGDPPSLSFAFGAHHCLGASLARSEAEILLRAVVDRWPTLALDPAASLDWHLRGPFRGLGGLLVTPT